MSLGHLPPEIADDELWHRLRKLSAESPGGYILEIGSGSGQGSTAALYAGAMANMARPTVICMEVVAERVQDLLDLYGDCPQFRIERLASVSKSEYPSYADVSKFYRTMWTGLNNYQESTVLGWLKEDLDYLDAHQVPQNGIESVRAKYGINQPFDIVIIDGSEFTGQPELDHVLGARVIVLDDVNSYKNFHNYHRLYKNTQYELTARNWFLRNGYAIFDHK